MLAQLVGNVDSSSAAVLIAIVLGVVITLTALISRKSKRAVSLDFDLEMARLQNARDERAVQLANNREIEMKKVDRGLTTLSRANHEE